MGLIDFFTHRDLKERISRLETDIRKIKLSMEGVIALEQRILDSLDEPRTTGELASELGRSRSWISHVLNELEKSGKVEEIGRRGREILYGKSS